MTYFNRINLPTKRYEKTTGPSLTVPDQTLSLQELVKRYTRGQSVATLTPIYEEEDAGLPDTTGMDKMQKIDMLRNVATEVAEIRDTIRQEQQKKQNERSKKAFDEAVQKAATERLQNQVKGDASDPQL